MHIYTTFDHCCCPRGKATLSHQSHVAILCRDMSPKLFQKLREQIDQVPLHQELLNVLLLSPKICIYSPVKWVKKRQTISKLLVTMQNVILSKRKLTVYWILDGWSRLPHKRVGVLQQLSGTTLPSCWTFSSLYHSLASQSSNLRAPQHLNYNIQKKKNIQRHLFTYSFSLFFLIHYVTYSIFSNLFLSSSFFPFFSTAVNPANPEQI